MSSLGERFAEGRQAGRTGFIPFIVAGDPDLETTVDLLRGLSRLKPTAIELGIPFSDPIADGPVIQRAGQRALGNGTNLPKILKMLRRFRPNELAPIVLFGYYNPVLQFGLRRFARTAAACGVSGVLVVDLPVEAGASLREALSKEKIDLIFLVAPTTREERLKQIVRLGSGFIYVVSRTGVTGTARELADESKQLVARVRAISDLPVAVGFGIRTRAQARRVCRYADAAVVGSRLVAAIEEGNLKSSSRRVIVGSVLQCARQFA